MSNELEQLPEMTVMALTPSELELVKKYQKEKPNKPLTSEQIEAISMLADGKSWKVIMKELGLQSYTLASWKKQKRFQEALTAISDTAVESAKERIKVAMPAIVDKMIELAEEGNITAIKDLMDRIFANATTGGGNSQQQQNIQIKVNLAAHRESEV